MGVVPAVEPVLMATCMKRQLFVFFIMTSYNPKLYIVVYRLSRFIGGLNIW